MADAATDRALFGTTCPRDRTGGECEPDGRRTGGVELRPLLRNLSLTVSNAEAGFNTEGRTTMHHAEGRLTQSPTRWFQGKVAVVTGGGSGMGREAALTRGGMGVKVVLANRRSDCGSAVAEEIRRSGGDALFHQTDVADEGQLRSMVDRAVSEFGGLDLAFNNAGAYQAERPTGAVDIELARRIIEVQVLDVLACMRYQIPAMLARDGGAFVNNASALDDS